VIAERRDRFSERDMKLFFSWNGASSTGPAPDEADETNPIGWDPLTMVDFPPEEPSTPRALPSRLGPVGPAIVVIAVIALVSTVMVLLWGHNSTASSTAAGTLPADQGSLHIESDPAGADVAIDGVARGLTPVTLNLPAGLHRLVLRSGQSTREAAVTVSAHVMSVHHFEWTDNGRASAIAGNTGSLDITTDPPQATVTIDAIDRGRSPLLVTGLAPGEHFVVVRAGNTTHRRTVRVEPGTTASLVLTGQAPAPGFGWLTARTPVPLQVYEGDTLIGTTESDRIMLPTGDHAFEFVNTPLGFRERQMVKIAPGQSTSVAITIPLAPLSINAVPWAQVWLDGEPLGETPIGNISRVIGSHEVVFRHPDFGERKVTAVVTSKGTTRVSVDMRKP